MTESGNGILDLDIAASSAKQFDELASRLGRRPRVAIIGTRGYPSYYGGFETAVRQIAPDLVDRGWAVTVFGRAAWTKLDDPNRDMRVESVRSRGIDSRSLSTLTHGFSATIVTAHSKPDIALIMNVANGIWLPILTIMRIPTLVHVDGIEWERAKWGVTARAVFRLGAHFTAKLSTRLIYDAAAIAKKWHAKFGRRGFFIPYGGTSCERLEPPLGLKRGSYILLVARLVPENSISLFLDAISKLPLEVPVVIVGSSGTNGTLDSDVRSLADAREHVQWLGHLSDDNLLFALWQNCGVYFHGHTVGGTNPALVQAMTLGAPTIALDTVYSREVLEDAGHLVASDPDDLAHGMELLLGNPTTRGELSKKAKKRAATVYSWEAVKATYHEALLSTLAAHNLRNGAGN